MILFPPVLRINVELVCAKAGNAAVIESPTTRMTFRMVLFPYTQGLKFFLRGINLYRQV